jgi:hypothetical protein
VASVAPEIVSLVELAVPPEKPASADHTVPSAAVAPAPPASMRAVKPAAVALEPAMTAAVMPAAATAEASVVAVMARARDVPVGRGADAERAARCWWRPVKVLVMVEAPFRAPDGEGDRLRRGARTVGFSCW